MLVEVIPYKTFKERLQLIKELTKQKCKIEIFNNYLYVERTIYVNGR